MEPAVAGAPEVGDALLSFEPGSLGSPCEVTLEANKRNVRKRDIAESSERSESCMVIVDVYFLCIRWLRARGHEWTPTSALLIGVSVETAAID